MAQGHPGSRGRRALGLPLCLKVVGQPHAAVTLTYVTAGPVAEGRSDHLSVWTSFTLIRSFRSLERSYLFNHIISKFNILDPSTDKPRRGVLFIQ